MPYISQVAVGRRKYLTVYGDDYATPDGTGIRDYIHVTDLARGHVAALDFLLSNPCVDEINLGAGRGYSVLEVVRAFEKASGRPIPYRIGPRRAGDIAAFWADASKAKRILGWEAGRHIGDMCADAWRWQSMNPGGYAL
jgi:UDP-glucose 4-epimerase